MFPTGRIGPNSLLIRAAFVLQLLLLIYLQVIEWIDLFPEARLSELHRYMPLLKNMAVMRGL